MNPALMCALPRKTSDYPFHALRSGRPRLWPGIVTRERRAQGHGAPQRLSFPCIGLLLFALCQLPAGSAFAWWDGGADAAPAGQAQSDEALPAPAFGRELPEEVRQLLAQPFTGDLDAMVERRVVRIGVPFNRSLYFIDRGEERGVAFEYGALMEEELNRRRKTGNLRVRFWFVPMSRDQLLPALVAGQVDMVISQLTVTPERRELVDFTHPTREHVNEIVVTGPGGPPIAQVEDLSGQQVYVRRASSYYDSLLELNERLQAAGRAPVELLEAPESLETDDLLEMVNAGLVKATIADDYLAEFWQQVFTKLQLHKSAVVRSEGSLAVAIRKDSPQLAAALNAVIDEYGLGTVFGNIMQKRYFENTQFAREAVSEEERRKFEQLVQYFRKYGSEYQLDYLLMAAQGYQESRLDHSVKSPSGAVGVMQIMPATGRELAVGDIHQVESNIHAGVKYIRQLEDEYFKDEAMDELNKGLFAFASYNMGPARLRQLRAEAAKRGLDPNVWFRNVEVIASERIGRESVTYVSNIYKYYLAYTLLMQERERQAAAKETLESRVNPDSGQP